MSASAVAIVAALAAALHGASGAPPPASPPPAPPAAAAASDGAAALQKALERELPALSPQPFRTPSGIEGAIEAVAAPEVKAGDGVEQILASLGTQQALACTVYAKRIDAGATTWRLAESVRKALKLLVVRPVEIVEVAGSPLVLAELGYQTDTDKGPMVGQLKIGVYAHDGHSLLCLHDEAGYAKTFARIVKSLAASLRGGGPDERPGARFSEIAVMRIGDTSIGYQEHVVWDAKGGGRVAVTYGTQLLPRGPTDLIALDAFSNEQTDAKDLLEAAVYAHMTNGEADAQLRLTRAKGGKRYRYEGDKEGKALQGTFATKAGLSTDLWFARRLAVAAPPLKRELRHQAYSYEANPVDAVPVVYRNDPAGPRRVEMELGPIRVSGVLDENGLIASGEVPVGPAKLVVQRVWSRGTP